MAWADGRCRLPLPSMDPFTHGISGALVNRVVAPRVCRAPRFTLTERTWLGALAALFPDADWFLRLFTEPLVFLNLHRGETHSLLMLPVWAVGLGLLVAKLWPGRRYWRDASLIIALGIGVHILGDSFTNFGTQLFAPVSREPAAFATTFILDPWITLALAVGLAMTWWRGGRFWAGAGLAGAALIIAMQAGFKLDAHEHARMAAEARGLYGARLHAMPQPLSPFHWRLFVEEDDRIHSAHLGFFTEGREVAEGAGMLARHWGAFRPADDLRWRTYARFGDDDERGFAELAWRQPEAAGYRRFAQLPYLRDVTMRDGRRCAVFADLRLRVEAVPPPLQYAMCRDARGEWELQNVSLWEELEP